MRHVQQIRYKAPIYWKILIIGFSHTKMILILTKSIRNSIKKQLKVMGCSLAQYEFVTLVVKDIISTSSRDQNLVLCGLINEIHAAILKRYINHLELVYGE